MIFRIQGVLIAILVKVVKAEQGRILRKALYERHFAKQYLT